MKAHSEPAQAFNEDARPFRLTFFALYRPYAGMLILGLVWLVATNLISAWLPRLVKKSVDQIVAPSEHSEPLWFLASLIVALAILAAVFRTLSRRELFNIGRIIERDTRRHLFSRVILQSRQFFRTASVGDLMNHALGDVTNIRLIVGFATLNFFNIVLVTLINVPVLISINPTVALWAMSPYILVIAVAQVMSARMFAGVTANQEAQSRLSSHVQENLSGAQVVRLFGRETYEGSKFARTNLDAYTRAMKLATLRTVVFPLTRAMGGLGVAVVLYVGGVALAQGSITLGDFIEINTRLLLLSWPAVSIGLIISVAAQGRASLERINKILDQVPQTLDGPIERAISGNIEFQDVIVDASGQRILGPINARVQSPTLIGVVGPSGSGKSTLIACLLRQEERMQGSILFDGVDSKAFKLNSLFAQVSAVLPEPFLFGESVRTNLTFARPSASDEDVAGVLAIVGLNEDVARMPKGLDTLVGEKGVMLSGGQRQRIALARALLARPQILLLDDCFSAVDAETETHIVEALRRNRFAPTVIVVSHRLAAMRFVDDIWVLENGLIAERGKHQELLEKGRIYPLLWGVETLNAQLVTP